MPIPVLVGYLITAAIGVAIPLVMSVIRGKPSDRRKPGAGFGAADNDTDPRAVVSIKYGTPVVLPKVLVDYVKSSTLNSNKPDTDPAERNGLMTMSESGRVG